MKKITLLLIMLLISCTQKVILVDEMGRPAPNPRYTINNAAGSGLNCIFYFARYESKKDLDKSSIETPIFLEWRKKHTFKKDEKVEMFVEIYNPHQLEYRINDRLAVDIKIGMFKDSMTKSSRYGYSNQYQRTFKFTVPTPMAAENVSYILDVTNIDGTILFNIGPLKYSIED